MKEAVTVLCCLLLLACAAQPALAIDTTWYPSTAALGLDARALAMGGACLAVADRYSYPVNPAGLAFITDQSVFIGRYTYPNIEYDPNPLSSAAWGGQQHLYLAYAHPDTGSGAYGFTAYQNEYVFAWLAGTDRYHTYTAFQYGYGRLVLDNRLSLGINLRQVGVVDEALDNLNHFNAITTGDIGATLQINKMLAFSILVTDVSSPRIVVWDEEIDGETVEHYYDVPTWIFFGGSVRLGDFLVAAVDLDYNVANVLDLFNVTRAGFELRPIPLFAVRGGLYHGQPTFGFGVKLGAKDGIQLALDFAEFWPGVLDVSPKQCLQATIIF
ncbi:MAG: hypothetical protein ACM3ZC_13920 [Bacteroidota bacterium]